MKLGEWERVLLMVRFHWPRLKVLGIPHVHGEVFQEVEPMNLQVDSGLSFPDQEDKKKLTRKRESSILFLAQESCLDTVDYNLSSKGHHSWTQFQVCNTRQRLCM